jgi:2-polyprenyl-3-methyl-5-hydroxy-6-metoxy-1,4-benzoquinol methylase
LKIKDKELRKMIYFWQVLKYYRNKLHGFIYMPLRWAVNPFVKIASYMPKSGTIVDLGCGEGVMAVLLALSSSKRNVIGIDNDKEKIKLGKSIANEIPNLTFKLQDVCKTKLQKADGFVLSDFLHHTPHSGHKKILQNVAKATKEKGIVVIKEVDSSEFLRSKLARCWDFIFYPQVKTFYWDSQELIRLLKTFGFKVEIRRETKYFPSSTILFICRK